MAESSVAEPQSLFRTSAWVNAWANTWGKNPAIQVFNLGLAHQPLQQVYLCHRKIKKCIPINSLHLMGVSCREVSTPRAEYINLNTLLAEGSVNDLVMRLAELPWHQFQIPDVIQGSAAEAQILMLAQALGVTAYREKQELAYSVAPGDCEKYWQGLGVNTRLRYYNRRKLLSNYGEVSFFRYPLNKVDEFIARLNEFHLIRWGQPCYGAQSIKFMGEFLTALNHQGGEVILESMQVGGQDVSLLLDIVWQGYRYNLQSGYMENKFPKIALGALHMGYAIETALKQGYGYDFMAGQGKNTNYKQHISNQQVTLVSYALVRGRVKFLRTLQQLLVGNR